MNWKQYTLPAIKTRCLFVYMLIRKIFITSAIVHLTKLWLYRLGYLPYILSFHFFRLLLSVTVLLDHCIEFDACACSKLTYPCWEEQTRDSFDTLSVLWVMVGNETPSQRMYYWNAPNNRVHNRITLVDQYREGVRRVLAAASIDR